MIRRYQSGDTDALVDIWRRATNLAHPFLTDEFVEREAANLRTLHFPNAETWVLELDGQAAGFVALVGDEMGGLFLDPVHHGRGYGQAMVDHVAARVSALKVEVFEKNVIGRRFYERYGFEETRRYRHEPSGEVTLCLALPAGRR